MYECVYHFKLMDGPTHITVESSSFRVLFYESTLSMDDV